jgi:predicted amidophosphoribosyltransferase
MIPQNLCPTCGKELPTEADFCLHCGARLDAKMKCPHCSAELILGSKFCGECGKPVRPDDDKSE